MGYLLMQRSDYNQIKPYSTGLTLQIDDFDTGNVTPPLILNNLTVVQAQCVTRGIANDPKAVYLVQVTDLRGVIYSPWFQFPTTSQYNVIAPAYPGQYYAASTNAGTPWTWSGMVGDLWGQVSSILGAYPGIPTAPSTTPQNFVFPGAAAWEAICGVLDYLGLTVSANLALGSNPYSIVVPGATDAGFTALQAKYAGLLEDDQEWLDGGSGRVPGQVIVYFHRYNQFYGTEETVRMDALQWQSTPLYQVPVAAPGAFANAAGIGYLWADFAVRYDTNNNPLSADVTTATALAETLATDYYNNIFRGTAGYMTQTYSGVVPFTTGSQVDVVKWHSVDGNIGGGWKTQISRGYFPKEVTFPLTSRGLSGIQYGED